MDAKMVARRKLWDIAVDQHGYVTTRQAHEVGVTNAALAALTQRHGLDHVTYGVYRVPELPASQFDVYAEAVLWTGAEEACLSHDTALLAWDISDINPGEIHVTVSKERRLRRAANDRFVLHYEDIDPDQVSWWERIPIVKVPVAIEQCINSGVPRYLVRQAIDRSRIRGLVTEIEAQRFHKMLDNRNV